MQHNNHPPHLFIFDVDGTLLNSRLEILPSTRQSIQALLAKGHRVALASARPPRSVAGLSQQILGGIAEIISLNGAYVTHGTQVLAQHMIAPKVATSLIQKARDEGLQTNILSAWDWFVEQDTPEIAEEARIVGFDPILVPDLVGILHNPLHKMLLIAPPVKVRAFRDWIQASSLNLEASLSKPTYCEVVSKNVSKADAVKYLAETLNIQSARVVVFGDGENDLPMITLAGIGVAMGNAMEAVKRAAKLVTNDNNHDGIAEALLKLGFLQRVPE